MLSLQHTCHRVTERLPGDGEGVEDEGMEQDGTVINSGTEQASERTQKHQTVRPVTGSVVTVIYSQ